MFPELFQLGGVTFHTYGVLFGGGVLVAALGAAWSSRREGIDPDDTWSVVLVIFALGVLGGRLEFVRTHWADFSGNLAAIPRVSDGGMVYYGGFVASLLGIAGFCKLRGLSPLAMLDLLSPWLPVGLALGRVGCLGAGCCYGGPSSLPWAVTFPEGSRIAPPGVPLHPTQIYESIYCLFIAAFLYFRPRAFTGQRFALLLLTYPVARLLNELLRGDPARGYVIGGLVTNAQATSMLLVAGGAAIYWRFRGTAR
ncbi:MAG: prolipoprotein diacylglyceryl transferase [Deltaproteobacteria bacterium]|nr:prolipoprotein diacylglyceryl transferase [Deltaproteobacteria bacterium]